MQSSLSYGSEPRSVVVGDINNDHQIDIIVANSGTDSIGIFLSDGNGSFTNQQPHPTGFQSRPYSVAVNDFDNDGNLDIAVANYGFNSIGISLGHGNGSFTDQNLFSLNSSHPLFIATGDFNNDNQTDIAIVNYGTNNIGILLGNGDGSFENQITYFTNYDSIPYSLAIGDFNHDNNLDIAIANYGTNNVGILLGHGNGSFSSLQTYTTSPKSNPSSIVVRDFNNDNHLDIVVTNNGTGTLGIFFGYGNGTFQAQTIYMISSNSHPQYITVGDFNKDKQLDIVIIDSTNDEIYILLGNGTGTFPTITTYDAVSGSRPFWIAVADFNYDNQSDIVVVDYSTNDIRTLIQYSDNPSARVQSYPIGTPGLTGTLAVNDFNNDHILDIVFFKFSSIVIWIGLGDGTFGTQITLSIGSESNVQYISTGDLNNDNQTDIIISDAGYNWVSIFLGYGNGTFAAIKTYNAGAGSMPSWTVLADVNNDKRMDIVCANAGTSSIGILLGNGNGTFAAMVFYSTGPGTIPYSVAVGDINHDNLLDIVASDFNGNVIIFFGRGKGIFIEVSVIHLPASAAFLGTFSIVLADLNRDNNLDIAATNLQGDSITVYLGQGNGIFPQVSNYFTGSGSGPLYIIVNDFNNDNISDIAATDFIGNQVIIFYGIGNGIFENSSLRQYPTGAGSLPYAFTAADLDNNKKLEFIVALSGPGDIAVLTEYHAAAFTYQTIYSTGSPLQPFSLAVGDFNNDKHADIVVANSGTGNLDILFGFGNGTFGMEMMYLIGTDSHPQYVITIDINNDNKLDIVSVNSKNNSISVIMGHGNGTFAAQLMLPTTDALNPYAVASDDLNNDTWLDLIVANEGSDSIGIYFGFDYTLFQFQEYYNTTTSAVPIGIIVRDFNNDNHSDIAATFYQSNEIGIVLGYGNGSFTKMMTYSTKDGSQPYGIDAGDFNNDSLLDIVITNAGTNNIGVFMGYGDGSFAAIVTYSTGASLRPLSVAVGDLNYDNQLDIIEANSGTDSIGVLLGNGNGTFSVVKLYPIGTGSQPYSLALSDFNNDSRLDIVVANHGTSNVAILFGYGNGTFGNQMNFSTGFSSLPYWVSVGDFNNDNRTDIATANFNTNNVGILLGNGNGTFATVVFYTTGDGSQPRCIKVGDFNNDNILDLAVASSGTDLVSLLFGYGDGTFLLGVPDTTGINSEPYGLAIGYFNNDTRLDIAVTNTINGTILVHLANGSQTFAGMISYNTSIGSQPHSIAIADLNKDGWLDIVVANYGTDNVGVLFGLSNRKFSNMATIPTGNNSAPYSVAIADFDNDHQLDIVVTNSGTDNIAIFYGYGDGNFSIGQMYSTGDRSRPYIVTTGDFDNNNITDIAVANSGTSNVFLLYGSINRTFHNGPPYGLGYGYQPYSVVVKDLNQDNWVDIAIACYGTNGIETFIKSC
jgi:hypothetical protein